MDCQRVAADREPTAVECDRTDRHRPGLVQTVEIARDRDMARRSEVDGRDAHRADAAVDVHLGLRAQRPDVECVHGIGQRRHPPGELGRHGRQAAELTGPDDEALDLQELVAEVESRLSLGDGDRGGGGRAVGRQVDRPVRGGTGLHDARTPLTWTRNAPALDDDREIGRRPVVERRATVGIPGTRAMGRRNAFGAGVT